MTAPTRFSLFTSLKICLKFLLLENLFFPLHIKYPESISNTILPINDQYNCVDLEYKDFPLFIGAGGGAGDTSDYIVCYKLLKIVIMVN